MKQPLIVIGAAVLLIATFVGGTYLYRNQQASEVARLASEGNAAFTPVDSPSMGPMMARVQVMEFFDPACEACRAFYPYVKELMNSNQGKLRLTLRYAAFHQGSDYVIKVLEAARMQGQDIYWKSLEAILQAQPVWADHGRPQPQKVWDFLGGTGLDIERARRDMDDPRIAALMKADSEAIVTLNVRQTPTFFINGKPLANFGEKGLKEQVEAEIAAASR